MEIPLTQGKVALIDDADAPLVAGLRWYAAKSRCDKTYYARATLPRRGANIGMHQLIAGKRCDHKNGNGLDNRRCNLREATATQQVANRVGTSMTGFKGVAFVHDRFRRKPWKASIGVNHKMVFIGYFTTPEEAALAYDSAARKHFGEFACVNFPRHGERPARRESAA